MAIALLSACSGPQSALVTAGRDAERIAGLWWWLAGAALLIWLAVVGLSVYLIRLRPEAIDPRKAGLLIVGGGVAFPTVVLTGLLVYSLSMMPDVLAPGPSDGLRIEVSGEQWWWRVRYRPPGEEAVELANELRLPVDRRVEISVTSPDVIHSFWIPPLGGKIDMIPGRVNRTALEPTRTGVFRGVCAEYCGTSHALMAFPVVVLEEPAFEAWLERQAAPAPAPEDDLAVRGREAFLANGCGACHAIRGTPADGTVGPDLTHVGGRLSLGAGILPNEPEAFVRWISDTEELKPGVHMPSFGMLPEEQLRALAAYLSGLE